MTTQATETDASARLAAAEVEIERLRAALAAADARADMLDGNRGEQTMQAGNAVPNNIPQWLATRALAVLS